MDNNFKSGFIAIVGSPNVGKSTLLNGIIGTKVAITSSKPQTTRNVIQGVLTGKDFQIVFLDTPGLHTPKNKLGEYMMKTAKESVREVDAILFLIDLRIGIKDRDKENLIAFANSGIPMIVALNKSDIVSEKRIEEVEEQLRELNVVKKPFIISAKTKDGVDMLLSKLKSYLEEGPKYYPDDMYTDQPERFIAAEMIREKAMVFLRDELPYGVGVEIERVSEREDKDIIDVAAVIYCERQSHKGIIIGKKGDMLKKIGQEARIDLEMLFGTKVFLELWVRVKKDWRNSTSMLKLLGYE